MTTLEEIAGSRLPNAHGPETDYRRDTQQRRQNDDRARPDCRSAWPSLTVQPFKCGPDYIDPTYHTRAAGRPCRNLDAWMMPPECLPAFFHRAVADADMGLIEGVMGVFDGLGYDGETASQLKSPSCCGPRSCSLWMSASKLAGAAAVALGFQPFDEQLPLAGFILNRVGSDNHGKGIAGAITQATGLPVLGWLPRIDELDVAERHFRINSHHRTGPVGRPHSDCGRQRDEAP